MLICAFAEKLASIDAQSGETHGAKYRHGVPGADRGDRCTSLVRAGHTPDLRLFPSLRSHEPEFFQSRGNVAQHILCRMLLY